LVPTENSPWYQLKTALGTNLKQPLVPTENSPWYQLKMGPGEHEKAGRETINVDLSCVDVKLGLCYTKRRTRTENGREQGGEDNTLTEETGIT
jgi:hypothetical protein